MNYKRDNPMGIDLTSPAMQQDPYPSYAEMRHQREFVRVNHPVSGKDLRFITRYDDVLFALKDPRFVNDGRKLPTWDDWTKKWYIPTALKSFVDSMALADEPDHTRLRRLVHKAFTPTMIQALSGRIEQLTDEFLDAVARKPVVDFVDEFSLPLPLNVIGDMMGVSPEDRWNFRKWMSNTITDVSPKDILGIVPKIRNAIGLDGFLKRLVADRRANPKDDMTTALVLAEDAGETLSESELISMLFLLLFAGHETTANLLAVGTLALLQNPDQLALLKANPALIDTAIDELLRYTNPTQHIALRYNIEDIEVGGQPIPQYSTLVLCIAAANRDETIFENPEVLDITRTPNRHIAFGFGVHYCLGAPLARLEAKIAFTRLLERFPNMQLATPVDQLKWKGAPALRGLKKLPLRMKG